MTSDLPDDTPFPFGPILFLGDSITERWAALRPALFRGPQIVGRGIGGQTTRDIALRLRSEIATFGAKGLHLLCGLGDILQDEGPAPAGTILDTIGAILEQAGRLHVAAWVGTIPPIGPNAGTVRAAEAIAAVNAGLHSQAQAYGARVIDYHGALTTGSGTLREAYRGEGFGLSPAGYAALEAAMLAALTAPDSAQIFPPAETPDEESRRKFLHHFSYLNSNTRYPAPYIQFTGKPGSTHFGVPFDALGFQNASAVTHHKPAGEVRIFLVGDSTVIDGGPIENTLPARTERILRQNRLPGARVYSFGVMSTCLTQMAHLIWSKLLDYAPDAIIVLSGSTDLFQPWTYDPRPGYPYNAFITERLYDHFFDTHDPQAREDGLSYEALITLIYEELKRLRAEVGWQSPGWERAIVHAYQRAMHRLTKLSHDSAVPIVGVLQPTVLRKHHLTETERGVASGAFLAYLDRQYRELAAFTAQLARRRPYRRTFTALDLSGIFLDRTEETFYDIVHYDDAAREIVAGRLASEVSEALRRAGRRTLLERVFKPVRPR